MSPRTESVTFEPENAGELARFFVSNKGRYNEIWVVLTKKEHADPQPVSFTEAVNAAVKQGLVDSRTKTLTEQKYLIRFTKRKAKKPAEPEK